MVENRLSCSADIYTTAAELKPTGESFNSIITEKTKIMPPIDHRTEKRRGS